jgi:F-type H+-transporting ATPase subunit b
MGFSWSTFVIQILNFIVLVWILTRFLYQPVTRAVAARQKAIREELQQADEVKRQSQALSRQYDDRLKDWEREKARLKASFDTELSNERTTREADLRASLQREREQAQAAARAHDRETARRLQRQALQDASQFCARLLARVASPELESRLVDAAIADMRALSDDQRTSLSRAFDGRDEAVVMTRYPLDDVHRARLTNELTRCLGRAPHARFEQSDVLLAGLRVDLGTMTLEGNLAGELRWFAQVNGA